MATCCQSNSTFFDSCCFSCVVQAVSPLQTCFKQMLSMGPRIVLNNCTLYTLLPFGDALIGNIVVQQYRPAVRTTCQEWTHRKRWRQTITGRFADKHSRCIRGQSVPLSFRIDIHTNICKYRLFANEWQHTHTQSQQYRRQRIETYKSNTTLILKYSRPISATGQIFLKSIKTLLKPTQQRRTACNNTVGMKQRLDSS